MRAARLVLRSVAPFLVALPVLWLVQGALPQYHSFVFISVAVNVILAVSLNVVNGFTGQFSIGHAAFMAVGAYTAALVTTGMETFQIAELPPSASDAVIFLLAMVAGYTVSSFRDGIAFAVLILVLLLRPEGLLGRVTVEKV